MIKLDPKNARVHSEDNKELISKSLQELGVGRSIVIDSEDYVVAGNGVFEQSKKLGIKTKIIESDGTELIVIKRTDLKYDDKKRRQLAIADNATGETSEWNFEELTEDEIEEWNIEGYEEKEEAIEDDFDPTPPKNPSTVLGDLYEIGEHRLLCGDSTCADTVHTLMNGQKADMSFTSPPYNVGHNIGYKNKKSKYLNNDDNLEDYVDLIVTTTNNALLNAKECFVNIQLLANNKKDVLIWLAELSNKFKDIFFWKKLQVAPAIAKNVCNSQVEIIVLFGQNNNRAWGNQKWRGDFSNAIETNSASGENKNSKIHNATFPVGLPYKFINQGYKKGSIILDLFIGTGTTMVASHQLNRKCYGMEFDPKYCDVTVRRMMALDGSLRVLKNGVDETYLWKEKSEHKVYVGNLIIN